MKVLKEFDIMLNNVSLNGRLVKVYKAGTTTKNVPFVSFSVAVDRDYKMKDGKTPTDFINAIVYGHSAKFLYNYSGTGDLLSLNGRFTVNNYTDKQGNRNGYAFVNVQGLSILVHARKNQRQFNNNNNNGNQSQAQNSNTGANNGSLGSKLKKASQPVKTTAK